MADPFNTVAELLAFTSFLQGAPNGKDSVTEGTFAFSQFESALQQARNEIYRRTLGKETFTDDRLAELKEAELHLATARLYRNYGERMSLKFPESNASGVASVQVGADTPPPKEKSEFWLGFMTDRIRGFGLSLLRGYPWDFRTFSLPVPDTTFEYETAFNERI